jgi:DNA-binding PadR family transcriptional regulator
LKPERRRFATTTKGLQELAEWLASHGIKQVAMESTGVYSIPSPKLRSLGQQIDDECCRVR